MLVLTPALCPRSMDKDSPDIHQDLTKYEGKVFAGLSRRTLACVSLAIAASVAVGVVYFQTSLRQGAARGEPPPPG